MHFHSKRRKSLGEKGIVSLIVTVILMMVISLIVIAFARTSRREQRDALDRQLSTNAFYAAESGVNAARKAIESNPNLLTASYMSDCRQSDPGSFAAAANLSVPSADIGSNGSNAKYTCLFVNPVVGDIQRNTSADPYAFLLQRSGGGALGVLQFYWDSDAGTNYSGCPAPGSNPPNLTNCDSGILRIELTNTALTSSYVYYVYPSNGGMTSITYGAPTGSTFRANCDGTRSPRDCRIDIDMGSNQPVYARVSSIYRSYGLNVIPTDSSVKFAGAQVMIDSTGRAADVQRRIQIRYTPGLYGGPTFAMQGGASICKKFSVDGTTARDNTPFCWGGTNYTGGLPLP